MDSRPWVRDEHGRDRAVVREQVALRDPLDREERLVEVRELEHALPAAQLGRHRLLDANLLRFLVVAQSLVRRRAQAVVVRALDELDLRDQLGLDPDDVAFPHTRWLRDGVEGAALLVFSAEQAQEALDLLLGEAGADAADVPELALLVVLAEQKRPERARAPALALRVPADDELLVAVRHDLDPVVGASPRLVRRTSSLREDPLEALFFGGAEESLAVVEQLNDLHRSRALVEQLRESLPARGQRLLDQWLAFHLEHVERDEDVARAGEACCIAENVARPSSSSAHTSPSSTAFGVRTAFDRLGDVREPLRPGHCPSG